MASPEVEDMLPLLENENWVKVGSLGHEKGFANGRWLIIECWCIYEEMNCPVHVIYEFIIYIYLYVLLGTLVS